MSQCTLSLIQRDGVDEDEAAMNRIWADTEDDVESAHSLSVSVSNDLVSCGSSLNKEGVTGSGHGDGWRDDGYGPLIVCFRRMYIPNPC